MKIQLLSDLHIEFGSYNYPECDSDVVVLAGDIHTKARGVQWAIENIKDKPVIYVLGNHEFYGKTYPKLITEIKEIASDSNVHVLENEALTIDNVNFLGCTLWTNFELFGNSEVAGSHCQHRMNDYRKIKKAPNYSKIRSIDTAIIHNRSFRWLSEALEIRKNETNVVVTHHGPSLNSVPSSNHEDLTTAAYVSDLEEMIIKYSPNYWLHGHLHNSSDYQIGSCRILCNPKGYLGEENPNFKATTLFEIDGK